ncbi:alpha/beta fold hydrolase [Kribbella sp. WER1]
MPFVDVPDGYLYFEQHGAGPDVVLLNGGLADVRMWSSTIAWLAATHRVTTWDYRDTGLSSAGRNVLTGTADFDGTQLWAHRLAAQAPHADLTILPGADHMPMFSAPDAFRRFVSDVPAPAPATP